MSKDKPTKVPEELRSYPSRRPDKTPTAADLPGWVKTALLYIVFEGATHAEAASRTHRSPATLGNYMISPGAKEWRAALEAARDDPKLMAKTTMEAQIAGAVADLLWSREAARQADDYKEVRISSEAILDRFDLSRKQKESERPTIVINIGGDSGGPMTDLEPIMVETIEEEEVDADLRLPVSEVQGDSGEDDEHGSGG